MLIIFSGKQYSGKDTAAKILMEAMPNFRRCAMGDIIKIEYAQKHGLTYEEIEANKADYRQGLIDLGNWGRQQSPNYWLEKIIAQKGDIVVTDVRIKHEYEVFKKAGAISIIGDDYYINPDRCVHCGMCINQKILRGGCMMDKYLRTKD